MFVLVNLEDSSLGAQVSLRFTRSGISISTSEGVVVEKGSEYTWAHAGPRELDGRPHEGVWVGVVPR